MNNSFVRPANTNSIGFVLVFRNFQAITTIKLTVRASDKKLCKGHLILYTSLLIESWNFHSDRTDNIYLLLVGERDRNRNIAESLFHHTTTTQVFFLHFQFHFYCFDSFFYFLIEYFRKIIFY